MTVSKMRGRGECEPCRLIGTLDRNHFLSMSLTTLLRFLVLAGMSAPAVVQAAGPAEAAPELKRLLGKNEALLAHASADLNGDGLRDVVFIVEPSQARRRAGARADDDVRTLRIAIRMPGGALKVVKENRKVVYCGSCGGVFGDPFAGLSASAGTFWVEHYGGSSWRWANTFTFAYSRRDRTWQLVGVEESSFHSSDPDTMESASYRPPRDFGKIDIADFDPQKFKGVGPR